MVSTYRVGLFAVAGWLLASPALAADTGRLIQVQSEEARVSVELHPAEATLVRRDAIAKGPGRSGGMVAEGFEEICSRSCQLKMPAGTYSFALALDDEGITEVKQVTIPAGDSKLRASFESRSGMRTLGWLLVATSPVTAYGSLMAFKVANDGKVVTTGQSVLGLGLGVTQLAVGLVLVIVNKDTVGFDIVAGRSLGTVGVDRLHGALPTAPEQLQVSFAF